MLTVPLKGIHLVRKGLVVEGKRSPETPSHPAGNVRHTVSMQDRGEGILQELDTLT